QGVRLPELIEQFGPAVDTLPEGLDITLSDLAFSVDTGAAKEYRFQGAFDWDFHAADVRFNARAGLKIRSWLYDGQTPTGMTPPPAPGTRLREGEVRGAVSFDDIGVEFFKNFTVAAIYAFKPGSSAVGFEFQKGELKVDALIGKDERNNTILTVTFGA